LKYGTVLIP
jgi:hypothetical protein